MINFSGVLPKDDIPIVPVDIHAMVFSTNIPKYQNWHFEKFTIWNFLDRNRLILTNICICKHYSCIIIHPYVFLNWEKKIRLTEPQNFVWYYAKSNFRVTFHYFVWKVAKSTIIEQNMTYFCGTVFYSCSFSTTLVVRYPRYRN